MIQCIYYLAKVYTQMLYKLSVPKTFLIIKTELKFCYHLVNYKGNLRIKQKKYPCHGFVPHS